MELELTKRFHAMYSTFLELSQDDGRLLKTIALDLAPHYSFSDEDIVSVCFCFSFTSFFSFRCSLNAGSKMK